MNTSILQNAKTILHEKVSKTDAIIYVYEEHIRAEGERSTLIGKIIGLLIPSIIMIAISYPVSSYINNCIREYTKTSLDATIFICFAIISMALLLLTLVVKYVSKLIVDNKVYKGLNTTKSIRKELFDIINRLDSHAEEYFKKTNAENQVLNTSNNIDQNIEEQKRLCNSIKGFNEKPFEILFAIMYWISIFAVTFACIYALYPVMTTTIQSSFDSNIANICGGVFVVLAIVAGIVVQALFLTKRDSVFAGSYFSGIAIAPVSFFVVTILVYIVSGIIAIIGAIIVIAIIIGIIAALMSG